MVFILDGGGGLQVVKTLVVLLNFFLNHNPGPLPQLVSDQKEQVSLGANAFQKGLEIDE